MLLTCRPHSSESCLPPLPPRFPLCPDLAPRDLPVRNPSPGQTSGREKLFILRPEPRSMPTRPAKPRPSRAAPDRPAVRRSHRAPRLPQWPNARRKQALPAPLPEPLQRLERPWPLPPGRCGFCRSGAAAPANLFFSTAWLTTTARSRPVAAMTVASRCAGALIRKSSFE